MSAVEQRPIRQGSAFFFPGGRKSQAGTLLLFPDRLVHVASNAMAVGMVGGAVGAVITQQAAKRRAVGRAARGGKGVVAIPFSDVVRVSRGKQGFNRNVLQVELADGRQLKFGVKFTKWAPDLVGAFGPLVSVSSPSTVGQAA